MNQLKQFCCKKDSHQNQELTAYYRENNIFELLCKFCVQEKQDQSQFVKTFQYFKQEIKGFLKIREEISKLVLSHLQDQKKIIEQEIIFETNLVEQEFGEIKKLLKALEQEGNFIFEKDQKNICKIIDQLDFKDKFRLYEQNIKEHQIEDQEIPKYCQSSDVSLANQGNHIQEQNQPQEQENNLCFIAFEILTLAVTLKENGNFSEALEKVQISIQYDPDNGEAYALEGQILNEFERYKEAIESCNKAIKINPKDGLAYLTKGVSLAKLRRNQQALDALKIAEKFDSNYGENLLLNLSNVLNQLERPKEALEYSQKAIIFNPEIATAYNSKASSLKLLGKFNEAQQNYEIAISLAPQNTEFLVNKAVLLYDMFQFHEALQLLEQARNLDPTNPRIYLNKCSTLRGLNRYEEALECVNLWLGYQPKNLEAIETKIDILQKLGRWQEVQQFKNNLNQ